MEKVAYVLLLIVCCIWLAAIFLGLITALPYGLIGLIAIVGIGLLFIKVLKERLSDEEDNYYSKNVDK